MVFARLFYLFICEVKAGKINSTYDYQPVALVSIFVLVGDTIVNQLMCTDDVVILLSI